MSDVDGRIGACETDIEGLLERLESLEQANDAIADVQDETVWYLEETRNGVRGLSIMLANLVHSMMPKERPMAPQQPEIFVPRPNRAQRRVGRNGQER